MAALHPLFYVRTQRKTTWLQTKEGGGEERWKEEKRRPLWLSGCSSTLWPYAAPGGLGIQATVSRRRGHLQMNPGGLFQTEEPSMLQQRGHHPLAGKITWPRSASLPSSSTETPFRPPLSHPLGLGPSHQGVWGGTLPPLFSAAHLE